MNEFSRREFIKWVVGGMCFWSAAMNWNNIVLGTQWLSLIKESKGGEKSFKEVMFYKKLDSRLIECEICPRRCRIDDGERGYCGNKENRGGNYYPEFRKY